MPDLQRSTHLARVAFCEKAETVDARAGASGERILTVVQRHRIWVALGSVIVVLIVLTLTIRGFRHAVDHTTAVASWFVALGTGLLAAATLRLAQRARDEAAAVRNEAAQVARQIQGVACSSPLCRLNSKTSCR